jgi:hypothetical protein
MDKEEGGGVERVTGAVLVVDDWHTVTGWGRQAQTICNERLSASMPFFLRTRARCCT